MRRALERAYRCALSAEAPPTEAHGALSAQGAQDAQGAQLKAYRILFFECRNVEELATMVMQKCRKRIAACIQCNAMRILKMPLQFCTLMESRSGTFKRSLDKKMTHL